MVNGQFKTRKHSNLITNGTFTGSAAGWVLTGHVAYYGAAGLVVYSSANTAINGVVAQVVPTSAAHQYQLKWTWGHNGTVGPRGSVEVVDVQTSAIIAASPNQADGVFTLNFTAQGPVNLRFIDTSTNTINQDLTLDNVSLLKLT